MTDFLTKDEEVKPRIIILISGSGSNMQAIAEAVENKTIDAEIAAVISNKPGVKGLERAANLGIPTEVIDHKEFASREEFDAKLIHTILGYEPNLVVLAGFMRILTGDFTNAFEGKILNIHPSLLPKYQGLNTHQRALDARDKEHGVSVHFVNEELDGGPIAIQAVVPVESDDDADRLQKKVQEQEHIIYPIAVKWFCEGRLKMENGAAFMDDQPLPLNGVQLNAGMTPS